MKLCLYGTAACHLCEQAEAALNNLGLSFRSVDIADDDALMQRYGLKIPVLRNTERQAELCWPFTEQEISCWLEQRQ